MIWLFNHDTQQTTKMTLTEFMKKFNKGEIPDEVYTIQSMQYEHPEDTGTVEDDGEFPDDESEIAALLEIEKIVTHLKHTGALTEH
tara:strand:- start:95 stop:352 length:258 start_codon:yes stop_codon:yes gene_type:complete